MILSAARLVIGVRSRRAITRERRTGFNLSFSRFRARLQWIYICMGESDVRVDVGRAVCVCLCGGAPRGHLEFGVDSEFRELESSEGSEEMSHVV